LISDLQTISRSVTDPGRSRAYGRRSISRFLLRAVFAVLFAGVLAACQSSAPEKSPASVVPVPGPTATAVAAPAAAAPATTNVPVEAPAAAATATAMPAAPATITLTDTLEREVELPAEPPARIISLAPSATEILFAIGAGDRVVGVDDFSTFPAETAGLPTLGSFSPDLERIVALEPDLVVGSTITSSELIEQIEALDIAVFIVGSFDVRGVADSIRLLGEAVGATEAAEEVAADLTARIEAVVAAVAGRERPLVFHELDASDPSRPYTVGPGNFIHDLITLAGGENVFGDADTPFPQVGLEDVIARDPEVIILADAPFGTTIESVEARAGWDGVSAVVNGAFLEVTQELSDQISRPGPRIADGLEAVARFLHPEAFE
jgi:iron complex transport system substrate-binding protein